MSAALAHPGAAPRTRTAAPARRWELAVEAVATSCGRMVERCERVLDVSPAPPGSCAAVLRWKAAQPRTCNSENLYSLWEPVLGDTRYEVVRVARGRQWGLAHTLKASQALAFGEWVYWEMGQQKRAVELIIATCIELQSPLATLYPSCGQVRLLGRPRTCAGVE